MFFYIMVHFESVIVILISFLLLTEIVTKQNYPNDYLISKWLLGHFPIYNVCGLLLEKLEEKYTQNNGTTEYINVA